MKYNGTQLIIPCIVVYSTISSTADPVVNTKCNNAVSRISKNIFYNGLRLLKT